MIRRVEGRGRPRRRRILGGALALVVLLLLYFGFSYAGYMLKPTSETFAERSADPPGLLQVAAR